MTDSMKKKRVSKRKFLEFIGYDKKHTMIPIPKNSYWFTGSRGNSHCVVSCLNFSDCFYISDYGLCSISYCDAHAVMRILETMISGELQRGIWCFVYHGKLKPHWYYDRFMKDMDKSHPKQAKKLREKLSAMKLLLKTEINK